MTDRICKECQIPVSDSNLSYRVTCPNCGPIPVTDTLEPMTDGGEPELCFQTWEQKADANISKWGVQSTETLILAMTEELGELTQSHLEATHEDGDAERIRSELTDLAALCVQLDRKLRGAGEPTETVSVDIDRRVRDAQDLSALAFQTIGDSVVNLVGEPDSAGDLPEHTRVRGTLSVTRESEGASELESEDVSEPASHREFKNPPVWCEDCGQPVVMTVDSDDDMTPVRHECDCHTNSRTVVFPESWRNTPR